MNKFKLILTALICTTLIGQISAQKFSAKNGTVSFTSKAPLEDIFAESKKLNAAIDPVNKKVAAKVMIKTMMFENSLQQEHFNERYMESHEHPHGQFIGDIVEDVDITKPGTYNVTVKGALTLHGVGREREIPVKLIVTPKTITAESKFNVTVADHKIEIPKLVFQKVAEVVEVNMKIEMKPFVPGPKK